MKNKRESKVKRRWILAVLFLVIGVLILAGAYFILFEGGGRGGGEGGAFSTPENTVLNYYEAFNNRDFEEFRSCCSTKFKSVTFTESNTEDYFAMADNNDLTKNVDHIIEVDVSGEEATVEFELNETSSTPGWGGEENLRIYLVKEDGKWKVDAISQLKKGK
ncbi:hypothetical protein AKJ64_01140 [candidate division MSBL1 archaeon SCGC-AAA259E17]|uniref:Uncharacterized protein n=1 Tax=candidate division MSBL1 archaeon SCGC-AAA259E17 TaxID=1698263 RepID=A0A133UGE0_9EURY|nr:hypothetical protein AKJ64_01140 [candidate division MSBL1 archaeon SCGC-AAA259E17]